ncbi:unnamed protein product [Brassica oleracea var. botrytis]|uniref:Serine/threonine-protein kinase BSK n=1 Tax=Brassica oleracea TaxID=3712 RepID=A0A3P6CWT4_BRAOL|nr:unnamed protein product [Brassica oleracea]
MLMDSALDGQFFDENRRELMHIASRCLKTEPEERPSTRNLRVDVDADAHEYIMYICAYHFSYQKHGDAAFRAKDFDMAIELVSLCYLMSEMFSEAMQAQLASPEWPIALYLQAVFFFKLEMEAEAQEALRYGSDLEPY